ncbi:MAG TPA: Bcr/CflA family multidrug efflux MFS transporter [Terriglobales bacterium]|nr:Bcr/CflA family multidrug efflux MFS transporter [Terriglobales bacterium]
MMKTQYLGLIAILAGLMAFAPMSIDMYLPAMPELAHVFATDTARVQNTVASFFLGFAIGQAFYGPITDRFGRKKPLYVTLTLFALVSLGCVFAPDIDSFIVLRFLQAIAACAGVVIGRAVVRDVFESHEAVKVLGVLTLIFGLAPVLAPMIGGYLLLYFGWWAIFLVLALFGLVSLLAVIFFLPETHRPEHARPLALGSILATYGHLLGQRRYLGYALCGGFGSAGMFAYITGSPHVFMEIFGVLPQHYGWFFGANAMGLVLSAQVNGWLHRHASSDTILKSVVSLQALAGIILLIDALTGFAGLWGIAVPLFAFVASLGFVSPNTTVLAMEPFKQIAGAASALLGSMQFALAFAASAAVSAITAGGGVPMAGVIAACGILSFTVLLTLVRPRSPLR